MTSFGEIDDETAQGSEHDPEEDEMDYEALLEEETSSSRIPRIWLAIGVTVLALGAYGLWAFVLSDDGETTAEVQTAQVQTGTVQNTLSANGVVAAQTTTDLSFSTSGEVLSVNVTLGQEVQAGDVLATIEAKNLEDALLQAEINLVASQIRLSQLLVGADASQVASSNQSVIQAQAKCSMAT